MVISFFVVLFLCDKGQVFAQGALPSKGYLDSPANGAVLSGQSTVSGWFLDISGVLKIEVQVDGKTVGTAKYGLLRNDVATAFPQYKNANSGFQYALNTANLGEGNHSLTIKETGKNGSTSLIKSSVYVHKSYHWTKLYDSYSNSKFYSQNIFMYRLNDVAYNGKVYVAVGDNGIIQTSNDGKVWKDIYVYNLPGNRYLDKVIWDGKKFIAISMDGGYLVSTDGVNWSLKKFPRDYTYSNLVYTGGKYFFTITGEFNPAPNIIWQSGVFPYVSKDGLVWQKGSYNHSIYQYFNNINAIQWNGTKFLGVGVAGVLAESMDGMNWTALTPLTYGFDLTNLLWNGSTFVSAGYTSGGVSRVIVSSDGHTWNSVFTLNNAQITDIAWNGQKYAMVVQHVQYDNKAFKNLVTDSVVYTSTNLKNWFREYTLKNPYPNRWNDSQGKERYLQSIKWTGKSFVATGTEIVEGK
jgi:hypothetical protein